MSVLNEINKLLDTEINEITFFNKNIGTIENKRDVLQDKTAKLIFNYIKKQPVTTTDIMNYFNLSHSDVVKYLKKLQVANLIRNNDRLWQSSTLKFHYDKIMEPDDIYDKKQVISDPMVKLVMTNILKNRGYSNLNDLSIRSDIPKSKLIPIISKLKTAKFVTGNNQILPLISTKEFASLRESVDI